MNQEHLTKFIKEHKMKTITLTDDQFNTLFEFVDQKVNYIIDKSFEYQDSEMLEDWGDLLDIHTVLEETEKAAL